MENADPFLIVASAVAMIIVWFHVFMPVVWRQQQKMNPKPEPRVVPKEEPEAGVGPGKIEVPRPPVICSIELSRDQLFEVIAEGAIRMAGREDLREYNWTVTISLSSDRRSIKKATVEIEGKATKQRGHLWLVKE